MDFHVHEPALVASALMWASLGIAALALAIHSRAWRAGHAMQTDWLSAFVELPRRYLVDVHGVVARSASSSWMHALLAGGFVASVAGWAAYPWLPGRAWAVWQSLALGACCVGTALLAMRRGRARSQHQLSGGRFRFLPPAFAAYLVGSLMLVAHASVQPARMPAAVMVAATLCFAAAVLYLVGMSMWHPLRHAAFGALYIAVHPKPQRFGAAAKVQPHGLAAASVRPAAGAQGLGWKQLLSVDACIECGRCQAACPAFATGHALNPKALIQDLARAGGMRSEPYTGAPHPGLPAAPTPAKREVGIAPETLWSCTTCAACVQACPMFIEHVDIVTSLRAHATQVLGAVPGKLPAMLRDLKEAGNTHGLPAADRWDWATDLQVPLMRNVRSAEVLLWAGDAGFELHGQQALRALIALLRRAQVPFAVLGDDEQDCGHLARRCGDEATFLRLREENLATLGRYGFRRLVTADPHALFTLRSEYPAQAWEVEHHSETLARLTAEGRLRRRAAQGSVRTVLHDPCYLGRHAGVFDAPRDMLRAAGREMVEAPRAREASFCCGAGGGQAWAGQPSMRSIPLVRIEELRATGAREIAVACPNCKLMLQSVAGADVPVRDVAEILLEEVA